jgi:integrase/recombinase XerD
LYSRRNRPRHQSSGTSLDEAAKALRGLMVFCLDVGLLDGDPTDGIKRARAPRVPQSDRGRDRKYGAHHPIGTRARLAEALLLYTALRRSDIVLLGPQHIEGGTHGISYALVLRTGTGGAPWVRFDNAHAARVKKPSDTG